MRAPLCPKKKNRRSCLTCFRWGKSGSDDPLLRQEERQRDQELEGSRPSDVHHLVESVQGVCRHSRLCTVAKLSQDQRFVHVILSVFFPSSSGGQKIRPCRGRKLGQLADKRRLMIPKSSHGPDSSASSRVGCPHTAPWRTQGPSLPYRHWNPVPATASGRRKT